MKHCLGAGCEFHRVLSAGFGVGADAVCFVVSRSRDLARADLAAFAQLLGPTRHKFKMLLPKLNMLLSASIPYSDLRNFLFI